MGSTQLDLPHQRTAAVHLVKVLRLQIHAMSQKDFETAGWCVVAVAGTLAALAAGLTRPTGGTKLDPRRSNRHNQTIGSTRRRLITTRDFSSWILPAGMLLR